MSAQHGDQKEDETTAATRLASRSAKGSNKMIASMSQKELREWKGWRENGKDKEGERDVAAGGTKVK